MRSVTRAWSAVLGLVGVVLVALGVVYLVVACENLPGFMGPSPGDTSPRTPLGAAVLVLGLLVALAAVALLLRRRAD